MRASRRLYRLGYFQVGNPIRKTYQLWEQACQPCSTAPELKWLRDKKSWGSMHKIQSALLKEEAKPVHK